MSKTKASSLSVDEDVVIKQGSKVDDTGFLITVTHKRETKVVAIIEVKKSVNADFQLVEPKAVIEMILYVQYNMSLHHEHTMTGMITDGSVWHCLQFISSHESMQLCVWKYVTLNNTEAKVMEMLPQVLRMMSATDSH